MRPMLFNLGIGDGLFDSLCWALDAQAATLEIRSFPDGESYVRALDDCEGRVVTLACSLDRPNAKILPLLLAAETLRDLGAAQVGLAAPYLAYMRQDTRFKVGEGITSRYFADLLSRHFDWLATVDPHLHRFHAMDEIYRVPARVVHAAPTLAQWIRQHVEQPVLIGPDSESRQWVSEVAAGAGAPFLILDKQRSGDRDVRVSVPDLARHMDRVPVIIDDIVSTGRTAIAAVSHLATLGAPPPLCAFVHAVFADDAEAMLKAAGASRVVSCNTIEHPSNAMDMLAPLAQACRDLMATSPEHRR